MGKKTFYKNIIIYSLLLSLLIISFIFYQPSYGAGNGTLALLPNSVNVTTGATFTVTGRLTTSSGSQVNMVGLKLGYSNPSLLEITSGPNWVVSCQSYPAYDQNDLSKTWPVEFAGYRSYPNDCLRAKTQDLFTVTFRAKSAGSTTINLDGSSLISGDENFSVNSSFVGTTINISNSSSSGGGTTTPPPSTGTTTKAPTKSSGNYPKPTTVAPTGNSSQPSQQNQTKTQENSQTATNTNYEEKEITTETKNGLFDNLFQDLDEQSQVLIEGVITRLLYILTVIILGILTLAFSVYFFWGRKV